MILSYVNDDGIVLDLVPLPHRQEPERNLFSADSFTLLVGKNGAGKTRLLSNLADEVTKAKSAKVVYAGDAAGRPYVIFYSSTPFRGVRPRSSARIRQLGPKSERAPPDSGLMATIGAAFSVSGTPEVRLTTSTRGGIRSLLAALYEIPTKMKGDLVKALDEELRNYAKASRRWVQASSSGEIDDAALSKVEMTDYQKIIAKEAERWLRSTLRGDFQLLMHSLDLSISQNKRRRNLYVQDVLNFADGGGVVGGDLDRAKEVVAGVVRIYGRKMLSGGSVPLLPNHDALHETMSEVLAVAMGPASSGYAALTDQFLKIGRAIENLPAEAEEIVLIIDEGDAFLHFEWQQKYVKFLDEYIKTVRGKFASVQVVLATHSPIIMSDVPRENVHHLAEGHSVVCTFGAPLERIVSTTGEAGSIGEFAADRIGEMIDGKRFVDSYLIGQIDDGFIRAELNRIVTHDKNFG